MIARSTSPWRVSERTTSADRIAAPFIDGHGLFDVTTSVLVICSQAESYAWLTAAVCRSCSAQWTGLPSPGMTEEAATPAVSVVIPVLNGERFLGEQLAALSEQEVEGGFEVLACDNGSRDGSIAVAHSFDDRLNLRIVDATARRGQTYARNLGAALAKAPNLVFL